MSASVEEVCPRCGGKVTVMSTDIYRCLSLLCGSFWANKTAFDRECIARSVAGTQTDKKDEEYLLEPDTVQGSLRWELFELKSLITLTTLNEVHKMIELAIKGRREAQEALTDVYTDTRRYQELDSECAALDSMRVWVENTMQSYGEDQSSP